MGAFTQNLRYGLRVLAKNPSFTAAAMLCLALGIGATTAIFSVVNAVLLRQLPYAHSDRLVRIFTEFPNFPNGGLRHFWVSPPEFVDLRREATSFSTVEGWAVQAVNLAGASEPVRATAGFVSGGMFEMLGISPVLGRALTPKDDEPNAPDTAVLSYDLWQRAYGGDPTVVGRDIRLNGKPCVVLGVMPKGFAFPPGEVDPPELWGALQIDPAKPGSRGSHFINVVAQLKPGVAESQADAEMQRYTRNFASTHSAGNHPFDPKNHPIVLAGFQEEIVKKVRRELLVLLGAVAFVLLIACVNVANLLLARAESRRREIAVRLAIGAGLSRLLQQFIIEGVLLSVGGALLGLLFAFGGLRLLVATNAGSIPRVSEISIDWQVLLFTLAVSLLTGVGFGLAPALHMRSATLHDTLKAAAGRATGAVAANRFRSVLVAGELALALILLIGSGLMVKAFWKLQEVNAGFNPNHLLTMRVSLPAVSYRDPASVIAFYSNLSARVNALPGVISAAVANGLPPERPINANDTMIEGFVPTPGGPIQNIDYWNSVSGKYFETIGAHLMEGRFLNDSDGATSPLAVVVNHTMARTYWPKESALGHRIRTDNQSPWRTIVGVVADIKNAAVDRPAGTELFFPLPQAPRGQCFLIVRTQPEPMTLVSAARKQINELDRALPISAIGTMDDVMSTARARPRFLTLLLTMFSSLSLVLAALGIYGVISYAVAQRTNEIGIRMALGARGSDVIRMIGANGARLAIAGTLLGGIGALALTRVLSGMLFGVSSVDPLTFLAMAATLIAVTLFACYIPARRASRVDPLIALRYE